MKGIGGTADLRDGFAVSRKGAKKGLRLVSGVRFVPLEIVVGAVAARGVLATVAGAKAGLYESRLETGWREFEAAAAPAVERPA